MRRIQRGVVLYIALVVLVAMSLAGLALMRSVDTGTLIASNIGFRNNAMHVGDLGLEAARTWVMSVTPTSTLYSDNTGAGYYSNWAENLDLLGNDPLKPDFNWSSAVTVTSPAPPTGYTVQYVIHRLCAAGGDPVSITCSKLGGSSSSRASGTKGAASYGTMAISVPTNVLYRITVRVTGPRNTVSFVQAIIS